VQLHRPDVLAGALRLLDDEGLDRLTVRRLAALLQVRPGALHWHFASKQLLLDAMAEALLAGVGDLDTGRPGLEQLAEWATRLRSALLSHRDGARVVAGTFVRQPNTLRAGEAAVRAALAAGVPHGEAGVAVFSLQYYVLGQTIEEQARAGTTATPTGPPDGFAEITAVVAAWDTLSADDRFAYGLDLFLRGLGNRYPA
jgi:AcrR family transcriptional regulator